MFVVRMILIFATQKLDCTNHHCSNNKVMFDMMLICSAIYNAQLWAITEYKIKLMEMMIEMLELSSLVVSILYITLVASGISQWYTPINQ